MKRYNIYDMGRNVDYGTHEGNDQAEALDAMARSHGFANFAAAEPRIGKPLVVTQVFGGKDFVPMDERAAVRANLKDDGADQTGVLQKAFDQAAAPASSAPSGEAVASEATLRNWLTIIHDNDLALGDRLQRISSAIGSLLAGEAPDKYPPHTIREQCNCALDYEEVLAGHRKLVRELDVLLNGEEGAAKQASLADIVAQVRREGIRAAAPDSAQQERDEINTVLPGVFSNADDLFNALGVGDEPTLDEALLKKITDAYAAKFPVPSGYACNEVVDEVVRLIEGGDAREGFALVPKEAHLWPLAIGAAEYARLVALEIDPVGCLHDAVNKMMAAIPAASLPTSVVSDAHAYRYFLKIARDRGFESLTDLVAARGQDKG